MEYLTLNTIHCTNAFRLKAWLEKAVSSNSAAGIMGGWGENTDEVLQAHLGIGVAAAWVYTQRQQSYSMKVPDISNCCTFNWLLTSLLVGKQRATNQICGFAVDMAREKLLFTLCFHGSGRAARMDGHGCGTDWPTHGADWGRKCSVKWQQDLLGRGTKGFKRHCKVLAYRLFAVCNHLEEDVTT